MGVFIVWLIILVVIILIIRIFGAWMLRINEIIELQKETLKELKKINSRNSVEEIKKEENDIVVVTLNSNEIENKSLGLTFSDETGDVVIENVINGSACDRGGLKFGDIIIALNGVSIRSTDDLTKEIKKRKNINYPTYTFRKR